MRVLVCGSRNWTNYKKIYSELSKLFGEPASGAIELNPSGFTVIEGGARGADKFAAKAARALGYNLLSFPAQWEKYGKAAGPIRNRLMLKEGRPDLVLAFHRDLKKSKGTKDMVTAARKVGILVKVFSK